MRHVRSILYAVVLAAAVWVLCGAGFGDDGTGIGVRNYPLLLVAGAVYATLLFVPISPVGPLVAGLAFFAASIWALASPSSYADLWPAGVTWADLGRPGQGLAAMLAVPMFATALNARRRPTDEPIFGRLARMPRAARPVGPPAAGSDTAVPRVSDPDSTALVIDIEQTQLVRAPEPPAPEPARLVPQLVPELVSETFVVPARPADETMVIRQPPVAPQRPADETMAIPSPEAVVAADVTQVIPRDLGGDRQVIKTPAPADAEQTQVVRFPPAAEAPPAQAVTHPAQADAPPEPAATPPAQTDTPPKPAATPPAQTDTPPKPAATPPAQTDTPPEPAATPASAAAAEQTPAEPPAPVTTFRSPADAEQTQVIRAEAVERPKSATDLERPADEAADDTRRLRMPTIPAPRRQHDDAAG